MNSMPCQPFEAPVKSGMAMGKAMRADARSCPETAAPRLAADDLAHEVRPFSVDLCVSSPTYCTAF